MLIRCKLEANKDIETTKNVILWYILVLSNY